MQDDNQNEGQNEGQDAATEAPALPTTDELATELNQLEDQAADPAPETAPDPAEDGQEPPADDPQAPAPETDPAPAETPAPEAPAPDPQAPAPDPDPQAPPDAPDAPATDPEAPEGDQADPGDAQEDEEATPERTIAPPVGSVHASKRSADGKRRRKAIADAPRPADPSEEDIEIQAAKEEIRAKMQLVQSELDETLDAAEACRDELKTLSALLYPHMGDSDRHVDAVRGYVASQKKIRAMRASSPEQIKRILEAAGKAPIDAAFQRQRARGMRRPVRSMPTAKTTGGDAAPGADKPDADAA